MNFEHLAEENLIWKIISGSKAYGLDTPESDTDIRGIFIAPPEIQMSPFYRVEQVMSNTNDQQIYELKKFFSLLVDNNPNIIELLFVPERCILHKNPIMDCLLDNRMRFLSKKARHTFSGYAMSQLKRIKGHQKWITNPQPEKTPAMRDYVRLISSKGLEISCVSLKKDLLTRVHATKIDEHNYKLWRSVCLDASKLGMFLNDEQTQPRYIDIELKKLEELNPEFVGVAQINIEHYKADVKKWHDYWDWKKNRNAKRSAMEEDHGYDCKHASHLIRLLRMGKEILAGKGVIVERPDSEELRAIKLGSMKYEDIVSCAESLDNEMEELYKTSSIQNSVDIEWANRLFYNMVWAFFEERGQRIVS
jgi:predicted nucleotidyltransferase